ncbi:MAG: Uma2 family endonuclease [Candidatus Omnitrophota bacterium]|jgi:Uma2 family endonuclease
MIEYLENGVRLGWLVDPVTKTLAVYRPDAEPLVLDAPAGIEDVAELPGFSMDITPIWE